MESPFQVQQRVTKDAVIYDLAGDLSHQAEDMLLGLRDWSQGLEPGQYIILNLTKVPYINSMGISILIRIVRSLMGAGCQTFAYGITPHYQKLFRMVGLTEHMMIYPSEYSILQHIKQLKEQ